MRNFFHHVVATGCVASLLFSFSTQAESQKIDEYCDSDTCTLQKTDLIRILDDAFKLGQRIAAGKVCRKLYVGKNGTNFDEEYYEVRDFWNVYGSDSESGKKIVMQYQPRENTSSIPNMYRIDLSKNTIEWRSNLLETWKETTMGEESSWFEIVGMPKSGLPIVDFVRATGGEPFTVGTQDLFFPGRACVE